jgi:hypothetical protein
LPSRRKSKKTRHQFSFCFVFGFVKGNKRKWDFPWVTNTGHSLCCANEDEHKMLALIKNFKKDALQQVQTKVVQPGDIFNLNEPKLSTVRPLLIPN